MTFNQKQRFKLAYTFFIVFLVLSLATQWRDFQSWNLAKVAIDVIVLILESAIGAGLFALIFPGVFRVFEKHIKIDKNESS